MNNSFGYAKSPGSISIGTGIMHTKEMSKKMIARSAERLEELEFHDLLKALCKRVFSQNGPVRQEYITLVMSKLPDIYRTMYDKYYTSNTSSTFVKTLLNVDPLVEKIKSEGDTGATKRMRQNTIRRLKEYETYSNVSSEIWLDFIEMQTTTLA
jgi:hypothetical protein